MIQISLNKENFKKLNHPDPQSLFSNAFHAMPNCNKRAALYVLEQASSDGGEGVNFPSLCGVGERSSRASGCSPLMELEVAVPGLGSH